LVSASPTRECSLEADEPANSTFLIFEDDSDSFEASSEDGGAEQSMAASAGQTIEGQVDFLHDWSPDSWSPLIVEETVDSIELERLSRFQAMRKLKRENSLLRRCKVVPRVLLGSSAEPSPFASVSSLVSSSLVSSLDGGASAISAAFSSSAASSPEGVYRAARTTDETAEPDLSVILRKLQAHREAAACHRAKLQELQTEASNLSAEVGVVEQELHESRANCEKLLHSIDAAT
jgi:hypothetical protein